MARQPYLPTHAKLTYAIGAGQINERPDFVAAIGRCVAFWSFVEHQMAILFGVILKADNEAAIAVFAKLRRSSHQREAIEAASRVALDDKTNRLLSAIMAYQRSVEKERNDLVHGHWGIFPDRADLAAWIAGDDHSAWNTKVLTSEDRGVYIGHDDLRKKLCVYSIKDLDDLFMRMNELWTIIFDFVGYVRGSAAKGMFGLTGDQLYDHLAPLPRIRETFDRKGPPQNET